MSLADGSATIAARGPAAVQSYLYGLSASVVLLLAVPHFRSRFLHYGARASGAQPPPARAPMSTLSRVLDRLAGIRVPHTYFDHFYLLSLRLFDAWAVLLLAVLAFGHVPPLFLHPRLFTACALAYLQNIRRLFECRAFFQKSSSDMWIGHYYMGFLFYLGVHLTLVVESFSAAHRAPQPFGVSAYLLAFAALGAQFMQHSVHRHLYELRSSAESYSLPCFPYFPRLLCPHYSCEIAFYLFLSLLAAPPSAPLNHTVFAVMVLTATNLTVTAIGTKKWYIWQFGEQRMAHREMLVPFVW